MEVDGQEFAFGGGAGDSTGVWVQKPKSSPPGAVFKSQIYMGECLPGIDKKNVITQIKKDFPMKSYHPIHNNCNNFSRVLVKRLCGSVCYFRRYLMFYFRKIQNFRVG